MSFSVPFGYDLPLAVPFKHDMYGPEFGPSASGSIPGAPAGTFWVVTDILVGITSATGHNCAFNIAVGEGPKMIYQESTTVLAGAYGAGFHWTGQLVLDPHYFLQITSSSPSGSDVHGCTISGYVLTWIEEGTPS